MPPWARDHPAPPAAPTAPPTTPPRKPAPPRRRITEYFSHKMKAHSALKNGEYRKKQAHRNAVTDDLEKYISYLSQTLSPKVLLDVEKQVGVCKTSLFVNGTRPVSGAADSSKVSGNANSLLKVNYKKTQADKANGQKLTNGFVKLKQDVDQIKSMHLPASPDRVESSNSHNTASKPIGNGCIREELLHIRPIKRKVPLPFINGDKTERKIAPANRSPPKMRRSNVNERNEIISSNTKLDSKMNGVTSGSNNLRLNPIYPKTSSHRNNNEECVKRTNRKSSACIANSNNLTWSKANNLKQSQMKQSCANTVRHPNIVPDHNSSSNKSVTNNTCPISMSMNNNVGNINVSVASLSNCHQLNMSQPCNGASTKLTSFVAVPQNVMLTALRLPQNTIPTQTLNHQNNMASYGPASVGVTSPTKLNGQFVFPLMQNLNGAVVQIPNLMAKMPNFVLPQTSQINSQHQEHVQNQQSAQFLINGTLLKLANAMTSQYTNLNKSMPVSNQSIPMNKNMTNMPVGITMSQKPNYAVNINHPVLMPQPGFIVTSVPNLTVKETWSCTSTTTISTTNSTCSNPIVQHPPPAVTNFTNQTIHSSSIPPEPVKPPDNPIQGIEPPSSTVKETDLNDIKQTKSDVPWLSKTLNNKLVAYEADKISSRPFANVGLLPEKIEEKKLETNETNSEYAKPATNEKTHEVDEITVAEESIFTQITVLEDVSSSVQNTLIETNFCSATTTEGSESGISSDKSIDSPSDFLIGKECDEDSAVSLSVSLISVDLPSSQTSPILKEPKILRFPPKIDEKSDSDQVIRSVDTSPAVIVCLWENCKKTFQSDTDLLEHLQCVHVESQAGKENYVCLWEQCKVRGKPSCSRLWLQRHTSSHGGNKPFKCIVDGCNRRFSTQILLERHVNNHFSEASPGAGSVKKAQDSAPKLIRRNGKKLRYRRQPWSARMFDFFDARSMEGVRWALLRGTAWRLGGGCPRREPLGAHTVTLRATLAATRRDPLTGQLHALLTYYPPDVIEDEWVPEKEVRRVKTVEIAQLPVHTKVLLYEQFSLSYKCTASQVKLPAASTSKVSSPRRGHAVKHADGCNATNQPVFFREERAEVVSGAKKRKMGRRHGGYSFWPSGR